MKRRSTHQSCQTTAPDGGWGWVVLGGSFFICLCSPSIVGCYGLIIKDIRESMGASVATTALVATMVQALNFLSAPFVAMIGYTFSFRKITFAGGLSMSLGLILAYFAHQIHVLYLTIGLLGGVGFGFSSKSSLFMVNEYFDKRRGLATGVFYSGAAVGRFVFPVIVYNLLETYGFRDTLLIWGAIMANICVCACLYQPQQWHRVHVPGTVCQESSKFSIEVKRGGDEIEQSKKSNGHSDVDVLKPFLNDKSSSVATVTKPDAVQPCPIVSGSVNVGIDDPKPVPRLGCFTRLFNTLDYSVFRVWRFYVVAIGYTCSSFATVNTYVFLPPIGRQHGYTSDEIAWLVPAVGIGEIFGRIIIPWMVDLHLIKSIYAYTVGVAICAALSIVMTFPVSFSFMLCICFLSGASCGSTTGVSTVLSAEAVGKKRLSSAIAFTQFLQGLFTLPSGFILGAIRDATGDYFQCFYVIGAVYGAGALIWIIEMIRTMFRRKRPNEQ